MKNRTEQFETLKTSTEEKSKNFKDERIWKPKIGTDGSGYAVVRFLPGQDASKTPWVRVYSHFFQGPAGKWYIENSRTTLGENDPMSELNSKLWNSGIEANKDVVRKQKRRTKYTTNVLVLKDPANADNEGKVFMYEFGQKIFEKVIGAMQPEFADDTPMNPFDLVEGANFRIKIKKVSGYPNYDSSDFERSAPLSEDMEKLKRLFESQYDVHELVAPSEFKSYDELKARINEVLGDVAVDSTPTVNEPAYIPKPTPTVAESTSDATFASTFKTESAPAAKSEDEDLEDYFRNLADK